MQVIYLESSQYKAWKALVAAKFNGVNVSAKAYAEGEPTLSHNPWKRLPYLVMEQGVIASSNAMARYIARLRPDNNLLGSKFSDTCKVDAWMEFCTKEIEIPGGVLVWSQQKQIEVPKQALDNAAADIGAALAKVESALSSTNAYLVGGEEISLADICLACSLVDLFSLVLDSSFRSSFPKTEAWYKKLMCLPQFEAVLGKGRASQLCQKSTLTFSPPPRTTAAVLPSTQNSNIKAASSSQPSKAAPAPPKNNGAEQPKKQAAPPTAAPAAAPPPQQNGAGGGPTKGSPEEQAALQAAKDNVRELKTAGADKDAITAAVAEMKRLKEICGEVDPPKEKKKKK